MVGWIDAHNNGQKGGNYGARAAADDIADLMNAQQVVYTYSTASNQKRHDGVACNTIAVTDLYHIWAVYDKTNHNDYYIVQEDVTFPSAGLGYTANHHDNGGDDHYNDTAFYMWGFQSDHVALGKNSENIDGRLVLEKNTPESANGTSTVTSGFTWGVNGSFGFNGMGGTGSVGGSVSYTDSTTKTITDFYVQNLTDGKSAKWYYSISSDKVPPKSDGGFWHSRTVNVGDAPVLARTSAQFHNAWLWEITGTSGNDVYKMKTEAQPRIGNSWIHSTDDWEWKSSDVSYWSTFTNTINLTPPPRN
jgi:hypothetical protein